MADPDIWLCHQCNDCSTRCPRGARPGDVLAAVRQQHVEHYAVPKFLGAWANQVKFLPLMLLIPIVLLAAALMIRDPLGNALSIAGHHGFYAGLFPHWLLIGFFSGFTWLTTLAVLLGVVRFWGAMKRADAASGRKVPSLGIVPGLIRTLKAIFSHDKFSKCTAQGARKSSHLLAFYGFVALFIVTIWAVIDLYVMPFLGVDSLYPFNLIHPMKIVANIGCAILIFGCVKAILDRLKNQGASGVSTSFDWIFVWLLLSVGITGLLTEVLRFSIPSVEHAAEHVGRTGLEYGAFAVYFVHLVLVFELLVYLPYSKFAHIVYRTVALVYAEHTGRNSREVKKA